MLKLEAKQPDFWVCLPVLECTLLRHSPRGQRLGALIGLMQFMVPLWVLCLNDGPLGLRLSSLPLNISSLGFRLLCNNSKDASMTSPLAAPENSALVPGSLCFPIWFLQNLPLGFKIILHKLESVFPSPFTHLFIQQTFNNLLCAEHNAKTLWNTWVNNLNTIL